MSFPHNRAIELPPPPGEPGLLTLKIELRWSEPLVWRRLVLPGDLTLDAVHTLLQAAMGWTDSHLHRFLPGVEPDVGRGVEPSVLPYFVTSFDEEGGDEGTREDGVRLDQVLREPGDRLTYLYDLGDGWEHVVTLESLAASTSGDREPRCLAGAGACPPEDVGGIGGHHEIAEWLRAGAPADDVPEPFEDADHALGWLPPGYEPASFDADEATDAMRLWARGEHLPWHGLPAPLADMVSALRGDGRRTATAWLDAVAPRHAVVLDDDDVLRAARPWQAILRAVGSGTRLTAAGYLPRAVVERIAIDIRGTDRWIGKANREDLNWPVAALRQSAQDLGLLRKAKGTVSPTARARGIVDHPRDLVAAVLGRLPLGRGVHVEAGWFALLALAAGETVATIDAGVAQLLTDRGWRGGDGTQVTADQAGYASQPTLEVLQAMAGQGAEIDPALLARLARTTLFGVGTEGEPGT